MGSHSYAHEVNRLVIEVGQGYADFCRRYEAAVPAFDPSLVATLLQRGGGWDEIVAHAAASAPHGFFQYWKTDTSSLMRLAGHGSRCHAYLMGNHIIAERMFRHEPSVMLYAPLRALIYEDPDGGTRFAIDQPSTQFASFAKPPIAEVGIELDRKLAVLLEALDVTPPPSLLHTD